MKVIIKKPVKAQCRMCGACCIALSISSAIPGMEKGKPADKTCIHLKIDNSCGIYNKRPKVCRDFTPTDEFCGKSFDEAMKNLSDLEHLTS